MKKDPRRDPNVENYPSNVALRPVARLWSMCSKICVIPKEHFLIVVTTVAIEARGAIYT